MSAEPERMLDLAIAPLQNGSFELEQGIGCGETVLMELHPCQVHLLAERAGLLNPDSTPRLSARHVWCVRALAERLDEIRRFYLDEIIDRCGSGIEFGLHLRALEDLVDEMLGDIGNAPGVTSALPEPSNGKSAAISVTPKRGRPAKPDALTAAERQAKHRAKQGELLPVTTVGAYAPESNTGPRSSDHPEDEDQPA